jgi:hypothetical protein
MALPMAMTIPASHSPGAAMADNFSPLQGISRSFGSGGRTGVTLPDPRALSVGLLPRLIQGNMAVDIRSQAVLVTPTLFNSRGEVDPSHGIKI